MQCSQDDESASTPAQRCRDSACSENDNSTPSLGWFKSGTERTPLRPLIGIPCQGNLRAKYSRFCVGQSYCRAVEMGGGIPVLLPLLDNETALEAYGRLDGLLLAGGGDVQTGHFGEERRARLSSVDAPRDRVELLLAGKAAEDGLPVLAICRGLQLLNVAWGGTLYQDILAQIPHALRHNFHPDHARNYLGHQVSIATGTLLAELVGAGGMGVNSFHHQAAKDVAPGLLVSATSPDGVIEALEASGTSFVLGVQWHPEELMEGAPRMKRLFEAFIGAAAASCHRR